VKHARLVALVAPIGLALTALTALFIAVPAAQAGTGSFGAGQYPYTDGVVCASGPTTTPLAAFDFGAGAAPGFLVGAVSSTGAVDTAALPFASAGVQSSAPVALGTDGFMSDGDIATYAALLSRYGADGTQHTAEVAAAVLAKAGVAVSDCAGAGDTATLLAQAAAFAGPYTVTIARRSGTAPVLLGSTFTASATVRSASGVLVPGVTVTFVGTDGSPDAPSAVTNSAGVASADITATTSTSASSVVVTAAASVSTGLSQISVVAQPSASDPSGHSVAAIYPSAPSVTTSTLTVPIDQTATPVVTSAPSAAALAVGDSFAPTATVTGMKGHSGTATFTIYGPIAPTSGTVCSATTSAEWTLAPIASTSSAPVAGDGAVTGTAFSPSMSGCYSVKTSVVSTDANPNATGVSANSIPATVIAMTAAISTDHLVIGTGSIPATVTIASSDSASATITTTVLGPVRPTADGCSAVTWTGAPSRVTEAAVATAGDGRYALTSSATIAAGCYLVRGGVTAQVNGLGSVAVPLSSTSADGRPEEGELTVLMLAPALSLTVPSTSLVSPGTIPTKVDVTGTYGQDAHVSIAMMYVPNNPSGCAKADYSKAVLISTGAPVAISGDSTVTVASGATPQLGCYAPVPKVTIDSNTAVTAHGTLAADYTTLMAGIDPNAADSGQQLSFGPNHGGTSLGSPAEVGIGFALALILALLGVLLISGLEQQRYLSVPTDDVVLPEG
jgi:hypothetical protein